MQRNNRNRRSNQSQLAEERKQTRALHVLEMQNDLIVRGKLPDVPDVPRPLLKRNKVYSFSRTYLAGQVVASTTVDQLAALSFTLTAFPNSAEFTSLFDQYRIKHLEVSFVYVNPASVLAPLYSVIDYDDATTPGAVTDLLQYQTLMQTAPGQQHIRRLEPRFDLAAYSGVFTSFALAQKDAWVDVASPTVQFYGIKYALPATLGGTSGTVYNIQVTGLLQFRNPR